MSPDLYFALTLFVRMAVTAAFLIAATMAAERAGPLIGGLVATLPFSVGPIYIFLAIDHGAHFIGQSALGSFTTNGVTIIFTTIYVLLAQRLSLAVSLGGALLVWSVVNWAIAQLSLSVVGAALLNVIALSMALFLTASLRHAQFPRLRTYWYDYVLRAVMVAVLVGVVVTLSYYVSPSASGNLATFPVVMSAIVLVLHPRVGGPATAAVMANAVIAMGGSALGFLSLHLTADLLGSTLALLLTLMISICSNLLIYFFRRRIRPA